ncbi:MAG: HTH domain-containing protein [Clostridia bacterium]
MKKQLQPYIILGVYVELCNGKRTSSNLAQKFNVSSRTILRYVSDIKKVGIKIDSYKGVNGGIKVNSSYRLPNVFFTHQEKQILKEGLCKVSNNYEKQDIIDLMSKLEN